MPTVAPKNEEQQLAFDALDDCLEEKMPSQAVCWAITQQQILTDKNELQKMRQSLQGAFRGRSLRNWTLLTICAEQVYMISISCDTDVM